MSNLRNNRVFLIFSCILNFVFMRVSTNLNKVSSDNLNGIDEDYEQINPITSANLFEPQLLNTSVTPEIGLNSTIFNFTVNYFDGDNNLSVYVNITINSTIYAMTQANLSDTDAIDGILYYYNTTLDYGYYKFQINCSDGFYTNSTDWISKPEVNPFYNISSEIILFEDDFEDGSYVGDWTLSGTGGVGTETSNSGIYSAYHRSNGGSFTSNPFDLRGYTEVNVSYWVQQGNASLGSEEPEPGEDLYVEYYNDTGGWSILDQFLGADPGATIYNGSHILPANALHSGFRLRFRQSQGSGGSSDWWHFDDVILKSNSEIILISPYDNASFLSDLVNFTWNSLNPTFGPVNYSFQISNISDFSNIIFDISEINETVIKTIHSVYINYSTGLYYWRVRPTFNSLLGNWSDYFMFNLTYNEDSPILTSGSVLPELGDQFSLFNFTVIYTDQNNNSPEFVNVSINGTINAMEKVDPLDFNYSDGCLYQFLTYLNPDSYNYTYYFNCSDGKYFNFTAVYSNLEVNESNI